MRPKGQRKSTLAAGSKRPGGVVLGVVGMQRSDTNVVDIIFVYIFFFLEIGFGHE